MEKQIEHLYHPLFLYIRKRINNLEDAEDITQEVFYKLAKSDHSKIKNIKHWLYTIAKNTITDFYRKKKIQINTLEDTLFFEEEDSKVVVEELSGCVSAFIKELPEEYQKIMQMSELENIAQKDIAEQLDMNYVTVRSKVQRGRQRLKHIFTDCCTILQGGKGSILEYEDNCKDKSCK